MKKTKMISSFLLAVVLCLATFVGFAKNTTATNANAFNGEEQVIGVSLLLQDEEIAEIGREIESLFPKYDCTLIMCDSEGNSNIQVEQIKGFISQNVDAIIVMPVDEQALVNPLTEAAKQDIAIIVLGPNHHLYPSATYVDFNYQGKAEKQVNKFLTDHPKTYEDYNILLIACNNRHGMKYAEWIKAGFKDHTNIKVDENYADNLADVVLILQNWVDSGAYSDAIFVCCNERAWQVVEVLEDLGFTYSPDGIPIYGLELGCPCGYKNMADLIVGLLKDIVNGDIKPTGDEDPYLADFCDCIANPFCTCNDDSKGVNL